MRGPRDGFKNCQLNAASLSKVDGFVGHCIGPTIVDVPAPKPVVELEYHRKAKSGEQSATRVPGGNKSSRDKNSAVSGQRSCTPLVLRYR